VPWAKWFIVLTFCLAAVGCSGAAQQAEEASTIKALALLYGRYVGQHRGQPPANEAEFRKFIEDQGPESLTSLGISDPAKLWISSRDKEPYVVIYGPLTAPPGPAGQPVVIYERKGSGGNRLVASSLGAFEEVNDARFRELVPSSAAP
jgi:hypothetical protein